MSRPEPAPWCERARKRCGYETVGDCWCVAQAEHEQPSNNNDTAQWWEE